MIFSDENDLKARVKELTGREIYGRPEITSDTTDYARVHGGMILRLEGNDYFVTGNATEGRFGLDDEPKIWVKYVVDLASGEKKLLKLVFREEFSTRVGPFLVRARRSPEKEIRILKIVKGNPHFMQGREIFDQAGNPGRLIEFVRGPRLYSHLLEIDADHKTYFFKMFPNILAELLKAFKAMAFLLSHGEQHGDIRSDHIIIEAATGCYVWIDFDYEVSHRDYDLWSLGNALAFAVGKGAHTFHDVLSNPSLYPGCPDKSCLLPEDCLLTRVNQVACLRKLFPYIPEKLNRILTNFSVGTTCFYEDVNVLLADLEEVANLLPAPA